MSLEAAKEFGISQEDLLKFLGQKKQPEVVHPAGNQRRLYTLLGSVRATSSTLKI